MINSDYFSKKINMNQYYYIGPNNQQMGPMPGEELVGIINMDTMVWAPGMANWMPAKNVPELAEALAMKQQQQAPQPPFVGAAPNVPPLSGSAYSLWRTCSTPGTVWLCSAEPVSE